MSSPNWKVPIEQDQLLFVPYYRSCSPPPRGARRNQREVVLKHLVCLPCVWATMCCQVGLIPEQMIIATIHLAISAEHLRTSVSYCYVRSYHSSPRWCELYKRWLDQGSIESEQQNQRRCLQFLNVSLSFFYKQANIVRRAPAYTGILKERAALTLKVLQSLQSK